jgi:hypothetical protein
MCGGLVDGTPIVFLFGPCFLVTLCLGFSARVSFLMKVAFAAFLTSLYIVWFVLVVILAIATGRYTVG